MQDEVNQEESEQNEVDGMNKGVDSIGKVLLPSNQQLTSISMGVVAWLSGNTLVSINVVTLRRTQLVLGWVTISLSLSFRLWIPQVRGQPHGFSFSIQLDSRHPPR